MTSTQQAVCHDHDCLVHRLSNIPSVQQALALLLTSYQGTKDYSPFVAKTLGAVESTVTYAAGKATPLYQNYLSDKVNTASKYATNGLDYLEEKVPAVKMTPQEMRLVTSSRWNESYVKRSVDVVGQVPEYSRAQYRRAVDTVNGAKQYIWSSLDSADDLVDRYFAASPANRSVDDSVISRVGSMGYRVVTGVNTNARQRVNHVRDTFRANVDHVRQQLTALDEYTRQRARAVTSSVSNVTSSLDTKAKSYGIEPEQLLLNWLKYSTQALSFTSHQALRIAESTKLAITPMSMADGYMTKLSDTCKQAKSVSALKDTFVADARAQLELVEAAVLETLDKYADKAPVNWIIPRPEMHDLWFDDVGPLIPELIIHPPMPIVTVRVMRLG